MSKQCEFCGKKPQVGNMVSHSQRKTKRRFLPNIQNATVDNKRVKICTSCIKTLAKA